MRKLIKTPLALRRETVRHLSTASLVGVVGGKNRPAESTEPDCISVIVCPSATCPQSTVICA
jgi:hypothetical protein